MKDKKEITNLEEIYTILYRLNNTVSSDEVDQKFETLKAIIGEYKNALDSVERAVLEQKCYKVIKDTQISLINSMIEFLTAILRNKETETQTKPSLEDKNSQATSFFNKVVGNLENALSTLSRIIDDASIPTNFKEFVTAFIEDLELAKKKIVASKSSSIIKLDSFNKLIDIYIQIIREENGYYPSPKVNELESICSNNSQLNHTKKKQVITIEKFFDQEVPNNLNSNEDSLDEQIKIHDQKIKDALINYHESNQYFKQHKIENPLIIEQITLLDGIFNRDIPFLERLKENTINETECFLNSFDPSFIGKVNKEYLDMLFKKYYKQYGFPSKQMLHELLLKQKTEYIDHLKNLEELIDKIFSKIKEIELNDNLTNLSNQYESEVKIIQDLSKFFEEKKVDLVMEEPEVHELLMHYHELIQQNNFLLTQFASECNEQSNVQLETEEYTKPEGGIEKGLTDSEPVHALEIRRISNRIEIIKRAKEGLNDIKDKLTKLISAHDEAEKSRIAELNKVKSNINQCIDSINKQLQTLSDKYKTTVICPQHVNNFPEQAKKLIEITIQKLEELPNLAKTEIVNNGLAAHKEIMQLNNAIENAIRFEECFNTLQTQLSTLAQEQATNESMDGLILQEINGINSLLINERNNYNQNSLSKLEEYKKHIEKIQKKNLELKENYKNRSNSHEINSLNRLLEAVGAIKTPNNNSDWTNLLENKLTILKINYLTSKIDLKEFKEQAAQTLLDNVTKDNLSKLTNEDVNTTLVGNLVRALAEFIIAIGYFILRKEVPRYNPQFFASNREKEFANHVRNTYDAIMAVQVNLEEGHISIQPQLGVCVKT